MRDRACRCRTVSSFPPLPPVLYRPTTRPAPRAGSPHRGRAGARARATDCSDRCPSAPTCRASSSWAPGPSSSAKRPRPTEAPCRLDHFSDSLRTVGDVRWPEHEEPLPIRNRQGVMNGTWSISAVLVDRVPSRFIASFGEERRASRSRARAPAGLGVSVFFLLLLVRVDGAFPGLLPIDVERLDVKRFDLQLHLLHRDCHLPGWCRAVSSRLAWRDCSR